MKHRFFLIAALFCCALAAGALCSSCRTGMVALIDLDDNLRMAGSGFDLSGTVTDEDGNPLDGVAMRAEYSRVNTATFHSEDKREEPVEVNSEFHVRQKGWTELDLYFRKDGYFSEHLHFDSPWLDHKQKNYVVKDGIQVKMIKKGPVAALFRKEVDLRYDFENGYKDVCDLSFLRDKKTTGEDWERLLMKTPLGTPPETPKYLELDFRRDENGEIVYGEVPNSLALYPVACIIRFHSDNPDDGLILLNEQDPGITGDTFKKKYNSAPESEYTKRVIVIDETGTDENKKPLYLYIKCENHYGKIKINSEISHAVDGKELLHSRAFVEIRVNSVPGDRNLTSYF